MYEGRWDEVFDALSDPYRRELLVALLEHNPQDDDDIDPLDLVGDGDDPEVLQTELVHKHLPKLEEMGVIEWDRERGEISTGPNWEDMAPLLELIEANRDELPEGWL
jgi:DNA-binding transcriptional ArsR family regulator